MAQSFVQKYYPAAAKKKSPYVILEPDEYTDMMAEEYVKYTDTDFTKMKSFSRMAKYIIVVWLVLATFIIVHQSFSRDTYIVEGRNTHSVFHSIRYIFSNERDEPGVERLTDKNIKIFQGLEKCSPDIIYKPDACNTCHCSKSDGKLGCTKMFCQNEDNSFVLF